MAPKEVVRPDILDLFLERKINVKEFVRRWNNLSKQEQLNLGRVKRVCTLHY